VKIEFVFSLILGYKVTIRKITNSISKGIKATEINLVGNIMLGLDSICGSDFIEQENHFEIKVIEIVYGDLTNFFENKPKYKLLEYLINFFFPVNYTYSYLFEVKKEDRINFLSTNEKSCFMNINSYLCCSN
jgi:hypothetical protein